MSAVGCPWASWNFIALCGFLDGRQFAGDRHHAARTAADRLQPRCRDRKSSPIRRFLPIFFGFGLAQLFYGPLSDRFGRRIPLLIGLCIYIVAAFGIAVVPTLPVFWRRASSRVLVPPRPASLLFPSSAMFGPAAVEKQGVGGVQDRIADSQG